MTLTPPLLWLLPASALALLWPLSDPAANQAIFISMNNLGGELPATFWSVLTVMGDSLVALCLLLPFLNRRPDLVLAALLASLPATVLTHGLKQAVGNPRPYAVLGEQIHVIGPALKTGAFPSGHTTTAFVLATVLTLSLRGKYAAVLLGVALLIGLSRIAVGAHWPLDVAGGIIGGCLSGWLGWILAGCWQVHQRLHVVTAARLLLIACALVLLFDYNTGYPLARPFEQALALAILAFHLVPGGALAIGHGSKP